ncbi:HNH endonuclease [Brevibacterium sp. p3-SID960]|uniref:HNH endonuclease signature motif containing protein n=1 Tax=Brevibacterium sp. p3-SID960 TaxID=2916063 RepID=UPI0021A3490A|nr:HNH endonuclease signature motif containing protein [Brevibacterium sp. p3-SID960]MCT1690003.1 HNH endonuclease [Brevibacterium sp. p3-SID960]
MSVTQQPMAREGDDALLGVADFSDCLYRLTSVARAVDSQRMTELGHLFDAFLARTSADAREDFAEQIAAIRWLAADPRALGLADRDVTDLRNEAERRHQACVWLLERLSATSLMHLADALDTTVRQARLRIHTAACGLIGLPAFTAQARVGLVGFDRYLYAAERSRSLESQQLAEFDAGLIRIRVSDMTAFKRAVSQLIAAITTREQRTREIRDRRTVETYFEAHGQGTLIARGPAHDIALLGARLAGMARSAIRSLTSAFGIPEGRAISDDRTLNELMFDFLVGSRPAGTIGTVSAEDLDAATVEAANPARVDMEATVERISELFDNVGIECPVDGEWLKRQARVTITVPALTLLDEREGTSVPGTVDGSPIAPDLARHLVGSGHSTVYRLLTDPASGTVLDHAAESYTIPERMRIALVEKWQFCTLPGCDRSAVKAELDHIEPFKHEDPGGGGPTAMTNLHPLCREHHQMKTEGRLRVSRNPDTGMLTWTLPGGTTLPSHPPSAPIGQRHAQQLLAVSTAQPAP